MLRTAESDSLCTVFHRIYRISRSIRVGANLQFTEGIRPCHDAAEVSADRCLLRLNISVIDLSGGTIQ